MQGFSEKVYERAGADLGRLVQAKNAAYGDAINDTATMLMLLFPRGIPERSYADLGLLVRVWDKMKRIATRPAAFGESPWGDIAGYGLLGQVMHRQNPPAASQDKEETWHA